MVSSDPLAAPVRPAECATLEQNPPDFGWPDASRDAAYQITLTYPDGRARTLAATQNWINWDEVLPAGNYSWRVELTDGSGTRLSRSRAFTVDASATPFLVPHAAALLTRVSAASHPRGLPDSTSLALMAGDRQSAVSALQIAVNAQLSSPLPSAPTSSIESQVRDESQRTLNSLMAYLFTKQEIYFNDAQRRLLNLAAWDPRGSTSYATAPQASRLLAWTVALGYDWLSPRLPNGHKQQMLSMMRIRVADLYNDIIGPRSRIAAHPRDSQGHQALVVLAAISTLLAGDLSEANTWLQHSLPLAINATSPWGTEEGGFANGDAFGTRDVGELLVPWYILRWAAGVDLAQKAWVRNWARFMAYLLPPGTPSGVFGDGAEQVLGEPHARFAKGYAHFAPTALGRWYASQLQGEDRTRMEYLLSPLADLAPNVFPEGTPNSAVFPSLGQAALHGELADPARTSVYFKSSPAPYGSFDHSHADQNSFVVNAGGQRLAIDSGYYDGDKTPHWLQWYKQTRAHNAITFDGGKGQVFFEQDGKMGYGAITNYALNPDQEIVHGDATQAYGGALTEAKRSLVYLRPNLILVYDRLASDIPRQWEWNIHALNQMSVASDRQILIENNGQRMCVDMLAGPAMRFSQTSLFVPQQWHGNFATVDALGAAEFIALLNVGCTATTASAANDTSGVWTVLVANNIVTINDIGISVAVDTQVPSVPTGLTASALTATSLTLTWSAATDNVGVTGYRVYRNGALVAAPAGTSASLGGLSPSTLHSFTVAALDGAGNASAQSAALAVTTPAPPDTSAPSTPTGLTVSALSATSLTLSWSAGTDNVGVAGYRVYRDGVQVAAVAVTSYSNTGLSAARTYGYTVSAYDAAGNESAKSAVLSVSTPALAPAPFSGNAIAIPGTLEAENFDRGGEGAGYHDKVKGNAGGQYRLSEDVDIIGSAGGGYVVNNFETGEWLAYTIDVATGALYDLQIRASSGWSNSGFHVEIDGVDVTGTVTVPNTGSWSTFQWVGKNGVSLAAGQHVLKIVSDQQYFDLDSIRVTATPTVATPYSVTPIAVPGSFEAENFDRGGEGVAYHDNVKGNSGGQYRASEDVDIIVSPDSAGGGYVVNNFETGEWLAYTINVAAGAFYDIEIRASSAFSTSAFHVEIDGADVTGTLNVPNTGAWSTFRWVGKKGVALPAGQHALKVVADQQYFNLNSVRVTVADTQAPSVPANLTATLVASSQIDLSWSAATDDAGVTGYFVDRDGIQVAKVSGTSYADSALAAATTYRYTVAAYDAAGNVSAQSGAVSVTLPARPTAYSGTAIAVPGMFEAENFDLGGEGLAYHDNLEGNAGGQYRLNEDVDLIVSADGAGGGYVVGNFETGEWLAYTINVATSGDYDIELRAATNWDFPNAAYHIEIDGVNVTGSVVLPDTGGWNAFQWAGKKTLALSAGTHVLKLVSERQYFNVNQIRILAPASEPAPGTASLLFSSGFEDLSALSPVGEFFGTGAWQGLVGADNTTGFTWPLNVWGGTAKFQMIAGAPVDATTIGNYIVNRIEPTTGHRGTPTRALYSEMRQRGSSFTQDAFLLLPASEQGDLYISFWMKFQPDLLQKMTPQNWRAVFEWKTAGDYRVIAYAASWDNGCGGVKPNGALFWQIRGDNEANGGLPYQEFWKVDNCSIAVPAGEWFKFEVFWHRSSGADGRVWMAVNGQVIVDRYGPNRGVNDAPINRIFIPNLYSDSPYPVYQWVDDLEIWNGFPPATGNNPPYAPY